MSSDKSASTSNFYSNNRSTKSGADRDHAPVPSCASAAPSFRDELDQAVQLLAEIRGVFESRETHVLHTLLDMIAVEIQLLQKEQGGKYCHYERDIRKAFSTPRE